MPYSLPKLPIPAATRSAQVNAYLPPVLARALEPMAPPQSVVHQVITEDELLAADRARNVKKAERAIEREAERALDLQIKHQNLPGA